MRRRAFASLLGTLAIAGCTGRFGSVAGTPDTGIQVWVDGPDDSHGSLSGSVVSLGSAEEFPTLELTFVNETDSTRRVGFGATPPFSTYVGTETNRSESLLLVPVNASGSQFEECCLPTTQADGCWKALAVPDTLDVRRERKLGPGESLQTEYALLVPPDARTCYAAGTYHFTDNITIGTNTHEWTVVVELAEEFEP